MAQFVIDDFHKTALDALDPETCREIRKKVVWAGAKVVEKEMKLYIDAHHHVSGDMAQSVAQAEIHEDIDSTWVEVYPQGYDNRGVLNEMKQKIINVGYYSIFTGAKHKAIDPYVRKTREKIAPRIMSVMQKQFELCMEEINK
jgi:hypothetical protein